MCVIVSELLIILRVFLLNFPSIVTLVLNKHNIPSVYSTIDKDKSHVSMCCIFSPRMDVCVFILKNGSRVSIYVSVVRMRDYKIYYLQSAVFSLFTVLMQ